MTFSYLTACLCLHGHAILESTIEIVEHDDEGEPVAYRGRCVRCWRILDLSAPDREHPR